MSSRSSLDSKIDYLRQQETNWLEIAGRYRQMIEKEQDQAAKKLRERPTSILCPCVPGDEPCEELCEVGRPEYDLILLSPLEPVDDEFEAA